MAADDASAMLDALLGNVFAHTPEGSPIAVTSVVRTDDVLLAIEDGGPGLPDLGVLERGRSHGSSSGLGLDIAPDLSRPSAPISAPIDLRSANHFQIETNPQASDQGVCAVRVEGLEPPQAFAHQDLNLARLPIPPHPRGTVIVTECQSRSAARAAANARSANAR